MAAPNQKRCRNAPASGLRFAAFFEVLLERLLVTAASDRLERVRQLIDDEPGGGDVVRGSVAWLGNLCRAVVRALPASGSGLSVMVANGAQGLAAASDSRSEVVEELQFTLGEGPCMDAFSTGRPVLAPDLAGEPSARWPAYSSAAREKGIQAVFAFPVQVGQVRIGVLDMYRVRPGALSTDAFHLATTFADAALMGLLDAYEAVGAEGLVDEMDHVTRHRVEVYQAQGMVQVKLGVSAEDASARLRGYAFAHGKRLGEVAVDVVTRKLTFEREDS